MKRAALVLTGIAVLLLPAPPATAGPAPALCGATDTRGAVPAGFGLEACVETGLLVMVNQRDFPVLVTTTGDVGLPQPIRRDGAPVAAVTRLALPSGLVLMPGDSARWQLGAGAGQVAIDAARPDLVASTAGAIGGQLPRHDKSDVAGAGDAVYAKVVATTAAAVAERATCSADTNFLASAACDVATAVAVGQALHDAFPRPLAAKLGTVLLSRARWAAWSEAAADADAALGAEVGLTFAALPGAAPGTPGAGTTGVGDPGAGTPGSIDGQLAGTPASPPGAPVPAAAVPREVPPQPAAPQPAVPVPAAPKPASPKPAPKPSPTPPALDQWWQAVQGWLGQLPRPTGPDHSDHGHDGDGHGGHGGHGDNGGHGDDREHGGRGRSGHR